MRLDEGSRAADVVGVPSASLAPGGLASSVRQAREAVLADPVLMAVLESMPVMAVVLNTDRRIVAANRRMLQALGEPDITSVLGRRLGDVMECAHAVGAPGGCSTGKGCANCGALAVMLGCLHERRATAGQCLLRTRRTQGPAAMELEVQSTFLTVGGHDLVVMGLRDVSAEYRRQILERVFLHDLLNAITGLLSIADLMALRAAEDPELIAPMVERMHGASERVLDEIHHHRQLLAAEQDQLRPQVLECSLRDILAEVHDLYRHHIVARERTLVLAEGPDCRLHSDPVLIHRVLGNLVKNALEAAGAGDTVTVSAREEAEQVTISVHNPGVMPHAVQTQIFHRSFSTKARQGRGLGTYGAKLFTERVLRGRLTFRSCEENGTTFTVTLPRELPQGAGAN